MKFSYNILKTYFRQLPPPEKLAELINLHITEVEGVERPAGAKGVVIGKILEIKRHPGADKLSVVKVRIGKKVVQVVCGANNIFKGMVAPLVLPGTTLPGGFKIEKREIRGVLSEGMLASARELGMGNDGEGILNLPPNLTIGSPYVVGSADILLDLKILSNRPEYLAYFGLAKEIGLVIGEKPKLPAIKLPPEAGRPVTATLTLQVDGRYTSTYLGKLISGIKVEASPDWLRKTLEASGFASVNNLVDLANLVMLETGQPLHTFDAAQIRGGLEVRLSRAGEKLTTLDNRKLTLPTGVLVIADKKSPLALAGIIGGLVSRISDKTSSILLEAATFDPKIIRRGSKLLGIQTDASLRFERGLSPLLPEIALKRFLSLLPSIAAGAVVHPGILTFKKPLPAPPKISFSLDELRRLTGVKMPVAAIKKILTTLDFKVTSSADKKLTVIAPASRFDVDGFPDIAEEVLRFWGLEKVKPRLNLKLNSAPAENPRLKWGKIAREALRAAGFDEIYTRTLVDRSFYAAFAGEKAFLEVANPLSSERSVLRTALWPNFLEVMQKNRDEEEIAVFELGAVFTPALKAEVPHQPWHLAGAVAGRHKELLFRRIKGAVESVLAAMKIPFEWRSDQRAGFETKLYLSSGQEKLGGIGLLIPAFAHKIEREGVAVFELEFDELIKQAGTAFQMRPLPKFPAAKFDIAVVVDERVRAEEVHELVSGSGGKLLEKLELFDVFRGAPLPAGKKSLAYHLVLRSDERTLTDEDREKVAVAIRRALKKIGGEIRG